MPRPAISDPTHAYRRQARRIRGAFAPGSTGLYHSLRQLSDDHDASNPRCGWAERRLPGHEPDAREQASVFARHAADQFDGGLLRYASRLKLLKTAERLGIGRFHANLIIAAVEHEQCQVRAALDPKPRLRRLPFPPAPLLAFALVQGLILLVFWAALLR